MSMFSPSGVMIIIALPPHVSMTYISSVSETLGVSEAVVKEVNRTDKIQKQKNLIYVPFHFLWATINTLNILAGFQVIDKISFFFS